MGHLVPAARAESHVSNARRGAPILVAYDALLIPTLALQGWGTRPKASET